MAEEPGRKQDIMNVRRAYTTGGKLGARQMFVFNEDGTIAGLKAVEPTTSPMPSRQDSRTGSGKFGRLQTSGAISGSMSVISMGVESKVAFSDANYTPLEGQEEGTRLGPIRGKPGFTKRNLLLVPCCLFFSLLTGADMLQSSN